MKKSFPQKEIRIEADGIHIDVASEVTSPIYTFGFVKPHAYPRREEIVNDATHLSYRHSSPLHFVHGSDYFLSTGAAEKHYVVHHEKPFFRELIDMITEGPIYKFIFFGNNAINAFRQVVGSTDPRKSGEHTIRHMYGEPERGISYNAVHASDSVESFVHEVELHMTRDEMDEIFWARIDAYRQCLESLK